MCSKLRQISLTLFQQFYIFIGTLRKGGIDYKFFFITTTIMIHDCDLLKMQHCKYLFLIHGEALLLEIVIRVLSYSQCHIFQKIFFLFIKICLFTCTLKIALLHQNMQNFCNPPLSDKKGVATIQQLQKYLTEPLSFLLSLYFFAKISLKNNKMKIDYNLKKLNR